MNKNIQIIKLKYYKYLLIKKLSLIITYLAISFYFK
ncbi:hypothetical protein BPSP16_07765 [Brachyspira pilosicoli SP16]|nr:hypothetical protein BPSP16_07765 [Brachyspira pilosicoli SP16]